MRSWGRNALALLAGLVGSGLCVAALEAIGHQAFSGDGVFVAAVIGLALGAMVGGALAVRISGLAAFGWIVAALLGALSLANVLSFKHPSWFVPAAAIALVLGGWLATRMAPRPKVQR